MSSFVCRHCGKVCDSRKGLVQHRQRKRYCFDRELALLNSNNIGYKTANQYLPLTKISSEHRSVHQGYYNTQPNVLPVSQSETGERKLILEVHWMKIWTTIHFQIWKVLVKKFQRLYPTKTSWKFLKTRGPRPTQLPTMSTQEP
jgi:hypothetical protein